MARGQGYDRSLAEAKEFQVKIEKFCVVTGFHKVMLRQGILCRDKLWSRLKGLVSRHNILCRDRVGQAKSFLSRQSGQCWRGFMSQQNIFMSR